jgi:DNA-binding transcriptional regulator GbsR (MarR family)
MPVPHPLPPLNREFITHFGEMGSRWGINRTVGQIYALLFVAAEPVNADEIAEALDFSRSNVSTGLKELQAWRLVRLRHLPGDRREYFDAPEDVWEIFRVLAEERRRREVEPTLTMLRTALLQEPGSEADRLMTWFDDVQKLAPETALQLMGMGSTVTKVLGIKDRLTGRGTRVAIRDPQAPALASNQDAA